MEKIKSFLKLDIVGVCIATCSIMIATIACKYQSQFNKNFLMAILIMILLFR